MAIKRNDMVLEIIGLYDKIDELKLQLKEKEIFNSTPELPAYEAKDAQTPDSEIVNYLVKIGKKECLGEVIRHWRDIKVERKGAVVMAEPYEKWVKDKVQVDKIPPFVSFDSFIAFFGSDLRMKYEEEKIKAINNLQKDELKEAVENDD
jgi:hypothetical protein